MSFEPICGFEYEFCEEFLQTISKDYRALWDTEHVMYKKAKLKKDKWTSLDENFKVEAGTCQKLLRGLRNKYAKEKKSTKPPTGSSADDWSTKSSWPLYDAMSFLDVHMNINSRPNNK